MANTKAGRRPKARKPTQGRPSQKDSAIRDLSSIAPPSHHNPDEATDYHLPTGFPFTYTDIQCVVCTRVLVRPLQLPCGKLCCLSCISSKIREAATLTPFSCPCLQHDVEVSAITPAAQVIVKLLDTLLVTCKRCSQRVPINIHKQHIHNGCPPSQSPSLSDTSPPDHEKVMQDSLLHLVSSSPEQIISVPTSGRVSSLKKNT